MESTRAAAVDALREALLAYEAYHAHVERGNALVHSGDDPWDLVEAARLHVAERVSVCRSLGFSDEEMMEAVDAQEA